MPTRYNEENFVTFLNNPRTALGEMNHFGNRINRAVHRRLKGGRGVAVMEEDWDNLLILDGCRYDLYEDRTSIEGNLQRRTSRGSESWEFMQGNFVDGSFHDTVYVTANPHAYKLDDDVFYRIVNLLEEDWDSELKTVLPEDVAQAARETHERYPNKRLLIHFMQPHFPFIGETGRRIDQGGIVMHRDDESVDDLMIWGKLMYGFIDKETVWQAYRENLDLVLSTVSELLPDIPGRSIITSDHGNLVGERLWPIPTRGYGHPSGITAPELVEVPWHVVPAEERRTIESEMPTKHERLSASKVEDRLRNLGYKA
ncbi:hypothetical protein [Haladaptatus sp. NG-SE-30]